MIKYLLLALLILPLSACQEKEGKAPREAAEAAENVKTAENAKNAEAGVEGLAPLTKRLSIVTANGKEHSFNIEIAISWEEKSQGLMHRSELAEDAGMLFYFGTQEERSFWMKNTLIPLDILFIKLDGTIGHIHQNAIPHDLTSISSQGFASAALEINGGLSQKLGIKAGDRIKHELFTYDPAQ